MTFAVAGELALIDDQDESRKAKGCQHFLVGSFNRRSADERAGLDDAVVAEHEERDILDRIDNDSAVPLKIALGGTLDDQEAALKDPRLSDRRAFAQKLEYLRASRVEHALARRPVAEEVGRRLSDRRDVLRLRVLPDERAHGFRVVPKNPFIALGGVVRDREVRPPQGEQRIGLVFGRKLNGRFVRRRRSLRVEKPLPPRRRIARRLLIDQDISRPFTVGNRGNGERFVAQRDRPALHVGSDRHWTTTNKERQFIVLFSDANRSERRVNFPVRSARSIQTDRRALPCDGSYARGRLVATWLGGKCVTRSGVDTEKDAEARRQAQHA